MRASTCTLELGYSLLYRRDCPRFRRFPRERFNLRPGPSTFRNGCKVAVPRAGDGGGGSSRMTVWVLIFMRMHLFLVCGGEEKYHQKSGRRWEVNKGIDKHIASWGYYEDSMLGSVDLALTCHPELVATPTRGYQVDSCSKWVWNWPWPVLIAQQWCQTENWK